jgi:arylsulfatase A-like enzyme
MAGASLWLQPSRRPNFVFILTDDQRQDTIGALGKSVAQTPNIDRLVHSGVTFPNAYCMGGHIGAVCTPSRMMIQRGRSWFSVLRKQEPLPNIASTMNDAGYVTYQFTKRGNIDTAAQKFYQHTEYPKPDDQADRLAGQPGKQMADGAIGFLQGWKKQESRKPFFLYLAGGSPHDPRVAAPEYLVKYDRSRIPLPRNFMPLHPINNGELFVRDERLAAWPRTTEELRRHWHEYLAVVTQMDHHIGRILNAVRDAGEYDNTYFLFTSDQGLAMGSHGLMGKQNLYEHSMRPGLIVAGPGIPKDKRVHAFAYLFDIFPTVCDLAGVSIPGSLEGKSLAPVLHGKTTQVRDVVFTAYKDIQRAVRQGRWKLIRYPQIDRNQLFDLQSDPDETHDLAKAPEHADRVRALLKIMEEQQRLFGDTAPLRVAHPQQADVDFEFYRQAPPEVRPAKR